MSYDNIETSLHDGEPILLYLFQYGNTYWRYCTSDTDQTVGLDENLDPAVWTTKPMSDEGVVQGGSDQNDLQLNVPANLPVALLFRNTQPSGKVWLSVRRWHIGDPDSETPLQWTGTVSNATGVDKATTRLVGRSIAGTYDKNGLRLAWDRSCPHALYGNGCSVDKSLHAYPREIATVDGTNFTCTAHSSPVEGTFIGGFLEWTRADGSFERKAIEFQDGNDFQVLGFTYGLEVGMAVNLYPGCARTTTICKLFNNLANYGGFPHMPGKSPFDGTPIF